MDSDQKTFLFALIIIFFGSAVIWAIPGNTEIEKIKLERQAEEHHTEIQMAEIRHNCPALRDE